VNPTPVTAHLLLMITVGLSLWGLPVLSIIGMYSFVLYLSITLPVFAVHLIQFNKRNETPYRRIRANKLVILFVIIFIYFLIDAIFGRQKFQFNLFLNQDAVYYFIEKAKNSEGQSRGPWDLIGAIFIFLPFALIDLSRSHRGELKIISVALALLLIFYDTGISRGFLLIAVMSLLIQSGLTWRRLAAVGALALAAFFLSSWVRGDFESAVDSNPLVEGVIWPVINLKIFAESSCLQGTTDQFLFEFLKKFLPLSVADKQIYTFNIQATKCIYPHFGNSIESISVFTYMGEFLYYKPSWLTGFFAGLILAALAFIAVIDLKRMHLVSTATFAGFLCIVLLRSRVQDVYSTLITLIIFLKIISFFVFARSQKIKKLLLDSKVV